MNTVEVAPYLWEIDNILSKKECSLIIDTAKPLLERNTVVDPLEYEGSKVDNRRTSKGAHFHRSMKYSLEFDMIPRVSYRRCAVSNKTFRIYLTLVLIHTEIYNYKLCT